MEILAQLVKPSTGTQILDLIAHRYRVKLPESREEFFTSKISSIATRLGFSCEKQLYKRLLVGQVEKSVWQELLHESTIHESQFYRFPEITNFVASVMKFKGRGKVWFSACSNGQEVYTLSERLSERNVTDVEIIGSDISVRCIETAINGVYTNYGQALLKSGKVVNKLMTVPDELKRNVSFRRHNLAGQEAMLEFDLDVIVCTRALIYYPKDERHQILNTMGESLKVGGYLCVGLKEDDGWSDPSFKLQRNNTFTVFKKEY